MLSDFTATLFTVTISLYPEEKRRKDYFATENVNKR